MWRSVPQTPQAPIWIRAAFLGILGQGTLWITGLAPGPAKVETRICCMLMSSRRTGRSLAQYPRRRNETDPQTRYLPGRAARTLTGELTNRPVAEKARPRSLCIDGANR